MAGDARGEPAGRQDAQLELAFLALQQRRAEREMWGPQKQSEPMTLMLSFLTLGLLFGAVGAYVEDGTIVINLEIGIAAGIGSIALVLLVALLIFALTKVLLLFRWMMYWLILAAVVNLILSQNLLLFDKETASTVLLVVLAVLELLTLGVYLFRAYVYPRVIGTAWFRDRIGARLWWRVQRAGPYSLTYQDPVWCSRRHTCAYRGQVDAAGRPHGYGHWVDDADRGEILVGQWKAGLPEGPFRSREFASGNAFENLRIAYVLATDDVLSSNRLFPSNKRGLRCGIAGVESSVSGAFYAHLPKVCSLSERAFLDEADLQASLAALHHIEPRKDAKELIVGIAGGEIVVSGHEAPHHANQIGEVVIQFDSGNSAASLEAPALALKAGTSEAQQLTPPVCASLEYAEPAEKVSQGTGDAEANETSALPSFDLGSVGVPFPGAMGAPSSSPLSPASSSSTMVLDVAAATRPQEDTDDEIEKPRARLHVKGWRSTFDGHTEALVFIPGFNCTPAHSMERLGQFLAMARLPPHIKPFLFVFPAGRIVTYLSAQRKAREPATAQALAKLFRALREGGVTRVHLMSHSMGAQVVLSAFRDGPGGEQGEAAQLFAAADAGSAGSGKLRLATATLLNPDVGLNEFVSTVYGPLRRVCSRITVVGNLKDGALFWSEAAHSAKDRVRHRALGRHIRSLHRAHAGGTRAWLDVDAIDTTWMDANVHSLRHSYFSLNPVLVADLNELLTTAHRACARSTLLHREGNVFTYCQAPAYVVND